jgi:hypothetical protein
MSKDMAIIKSSISASDSYNYSFQVLKFKVDIGTAAQALHA